MKDKTITISDLGLATLLFTLQFKLVGLERADEKRIHFLFEKTKGIDQVITDYWAGIEIFVPVQSLFNNQKILKNRLFNFK